MEELLERLNKVNKRRIGNIRVFPSRALRKEGEDRPNSTSKIEKITVEGRSTYFCP